LLILIAFLKNDNHKKSLWGSNTKNTRDLFVSGSQPGANLKKSLPAHLEKDQKVLFLDTFNYKLGFGGTLINFTVQ
jgi:hypothetical protein